MLNTGLEVVAWSVAVVALTAILIFDLAKTGQMDKSLVALLGAVVTGLLARGTQSAMQRSSDARLIERLDRIEKSISDRR